jgi:hypothetical protein
MEFPKQKHCSRFAQNISLPIFNRKRLSSQVLLIEEFMGISKKILSLLLAILLD